MDAKCLGTALLCNNLNNNSQKGRSKSIRQLLVTQNVIGNDFRRPLYRTDSVRSYWFWSRKRQNLWLSLAELCFQTDEMMLYK